MRSLLRAVFILALATAGAGAQGIVNGGTPPSGVAGIADGTVTDAKLTGTIQPVHLPSTVAYTNAPNTFTSSQSVSASFNVAGTTLIVQNGTVGINTTPDNEAVLHIRNTSDNRLALHVQSTSGGSQSLVRWENLTAQGPFVWIESAGQSYGFGISAAGNWDLRNAASGSDPVNGTTIWSMGPTGSLTAAGPYTNQSAQGITATYNIKSGSATIGSGATISTFAANGDATIAGNLVTIGTATLKGVTDGSNAPIGYVGEYISTAATGASAVPASGAYLPVATMTLTAGDYDLHAALHFHTGGTTAGTILEGTISTSPSDNTTVGCLTQLSYTFLDNDDYIVQVGPCRVSISGSATYSLYGVAVYTTLGGATYGTSSGLVARRIR